MIRMIHIRRLSRKCNNSALRKIVALFALAIACTVLAAMLKLSGSHPKLSIQNGKSRCYSNNLQKCIDANPEKAAPKSDANQPTTKPPLKHIAFLKVHKTASSTVQNIFLRFGEFHNLTFILPPTKGESMFPHVISFTNTISKRNIVLPPPGKTYDLLCCHVIYNREQFAAVLPADTKYIGIVRYPVYRFQSALKYFFVKYIVDISGPFPVTQYLKNPLRYEPSLDPRQSRLNNRMAVEFGFPVNLFPGQPRCNSTGLINRYISELDRQFDLILITERFDESIIYMRRILNWPLHDVLYIEQNQLRARNPALDRLTLSQNDKTQLIKGGFLKLEFALYDFAYKRLTRQISKEGPDFKHEVEYFRTIRKRTVAFCRNKSNATLDIEASKWNDAFNLTWFDCLKYLKRETTFISEIRKRMYSTKTLDESYNASITYRTV